MSNFSASAMARNKQKLYSEYSSDRDLAILYIWAVLNCQIWSYGWACRVEKEFVAIMIFEFST